MNAKKLAAVLLTGTLAMGLLTGCSSDTENNQGSTEQTAQNAEETTDDTSEMPTPENGKTLVVYYSATGNTEAVANTIAELTDADLFELEPVQPYSDEDLDWTDDNSRVSQEYANEEERDMELAADAAENWDSYDTVFIGYPKLYPAI